MDEHAEETRELNELRREHEDEARLDREATRDEGLSWSERVTLDTARWSR